MPQNLKRWLVKIGSGNGLMPSGNKPLPEPMLNKFYDDVYVTRVQWVMPVISLSSQVLWIQVVWMPNQVRFDKLIIIYVKTWF